MRHRNPPVSAFAALRVGMPTAWTGASCGYWGPSLGPHASKAITLLIGPSLRVSYLSTVNWFLIIKGCFPGLYFTDITGYSIQKVFIEEIGYYGEIWKTKLIHIYSKYTLIILGTDNLEKNKTSQNLIISYILLFFSEFHTCILNIFFLNPPHYHSLYPSRTSQPTLIFFFWFFLCFAF